MLLYKWLGNTCVQSGEQGQRESEEYQDNESQDKGSQDIERRQ